MNVPKSTHKTKLTWNHYAGIAALIFVFSVVIYRGFINPLPSKSAPRQSVTVSTPAPTNTPLATETFVVIPSADQWRQWGQQWREQIVTTALDLRRSFFPGQQIQIKDLPVMQMVSKGLDDYNAWVERTSAVASRYTLIVEERYFVEAVEGQGWDFDEDFRGQRHDPSDYVKVKLSDNQQVPQSYGVPVAMYMSLNTESMIVETSDGRIVELMSESKIDYEARLKRETDDAWRALQIRFWVAVAQSWQEVYGEVPEELEPFLPEATSEPVTTCKLIEAGGRKTCNN